VRSNGEPVAIVSNFSLVLCGLDRGMVHRLRSLDYRIAGNSFFWFYVEGGVSAVVVIGVAGT
jgi:hypothetical protein